MFLHEWKQYRTNHSGRSIYRTLSNDLSPCLAGQSYLPPLPPGYVYALAYPPPPPPLAPSPPPLLCVLLGIRCPPPPTPAPVLNPPPPPPPVLQSPTQVTGSAAGTAAVPCVFLGEQQTCLCSAGVEGIQICLVSGIYGPCNCAGGRMIGPDGVMWGTRGWVQFANLFPPDAVWLNSIDYF